MTKKAKKTQRSIGFVTAIIMIFLMMSALFAACGTVTISLDKTEASLYVGDSVKITATVTGNDDAEVEWSTSDSAVATVRRGTVSAVGAGSAVITAQIEDGPSATCTVTVTERTVTISQTTAEINLDEDNTLTLTATASDGGDITWSTSDPSVAAVNGGVVTAYDIGEVTITAQRGAATATCKITVTEPSRPADYYKITKLTNAECVADPGVWHYHADGSMGGDYGFESDPLHRDGAASATLNVIPDVENSKYFYFRYQPDQVEVGEYYTMTLTITVSEDCTLRLGSKRADNSTFAGLEEEFTANEARTVEYIGYRNESEPFSVRINTPISADKVSLSVKLESVVANDGTELPEYHTSVEEKPQINYELLDTDTSSYDMEIKNNAGTVASPGTWYYNQGEGSTIGEAKYDNGTITFNFGTLLTSGNNQLRYRPDLADGTKIKVEFTVTGNANATVQLALCDSTNFKSSGATTQTLTPDGTLTFSQEFTISSVELIFIEIKAKGEAVSDANFTISDIRIYKEVASETPDNPDNPDTPEEGSYTLNPNGNNDGSKANVCANAGTWFYMIDNGNSTSTMTEAKYADGTLTWSFTKMEASGFYLRIQPDFAVGTSYKISFDVVLNRTGTDTIKPRSEGSNHYVTYGTTAGETLHVDFEDVVVDGNPFQLLLNIQDASEADPLVLVISNITITAI